MVRDLNFFTCLEVRISKIGDNYGIYKFFAKSYESYFG